MKIAIPTSGHDLDAPLDGRLGRAERFLVIDATDLTWEVVDNTAQSQASQGAGIQAAQALIKAGATRVIATHCGPKAFAMFQAAGVEVYQSDAGRLRGILEAFLTGGLPRLSGPDHPGHAA